MSECKISILPDHTTKTKISNFFEKFLRIHTNFFIVSSNSHKFLIVVSTISKFWKLRKKVQSPKNLLIVVSTISKFWKLRKKVQSPKKLCFVFRAKKNFFNGLWRKSVFKKSKKKLQCKEPYLFRWSLVDQPWFCFVGIFATFGTSKVSKWIFPWSIASKLTFYVQNAFSTPAYTGTPSPWKKWKIISK